MADDSPSRRVRLAPTICAGIILVMNVAFYSRAAPVLRLVESSVCREYFSIHDPSVIGSNGNVPEQMCKVDYIQKKVAWLFALDELLHFYCGEFGIGARLIEEELTTYFRLHCNSAAWVLG